MREIKFRGKRVDNGEWVYGSLHYTEVECEKQAFQDGANNHFMAIDIVPVIEVDDDTSSDRLSDYEVDSATVGQFINEKDICNNEVYKDDIFFIDCDMPVVVTWDDEVVGFMLVNPITGHSEAICDWPMEEMAVAGNVHDNPELVGRE